MFSTLRGRILLTFLAAVVTSLLALSMVTYFVVRSDVQETAQRSLTDMTRNNARSLTQWITTRASMVDGVSSDALVSIPRPSMQQLERSGKFDEAYVGFSDKREVSSHDATGSSTAYDPTNRPWYKQAVQAGKTVVTPPYEDFSSKKLVMTFARPVDLPGNIKAVVAADVKLDGATEVVDAIHPTPHSFAFIVDTNGRIVVHANSALVLKPATALAPSLTNDLFIHSGKETVPILSSISGRDVWLSMSPIEGTDWKLIVALDKSDATAILGHILLTSGGVLLSIVAATSVAVFLVISAAFNRLSEIQGAMESVSMGEGDLTRRLPASGDDEVARIAKAFNRFADRIASVLQVAQQNSASVAVAAVQIAQGNEDLSARTERSAASIEQTAAALEELNSTIGQSAEAAAKAGEMANTARAVANVGSQTVSEVVSAMSKIKISSARIQEINGVIHGIAFQTNILALNAAVEAARAGEQGRGFAVVASEVRTLAQRSAQAAKEVSSLIDASVDEITNGAKLAETAGSTMTDVVANITGVATILRELASSCAEQSVGVSQVNLAVEQLDGSTQQNAALVEEAASASEALKTNAQQLAATVGQFRLKKP